MSVFEGLSPELVYGLVPRGLGIVYVVAFGSLIPQISFLAGKRGLLQLDRVWERARRDFPGVRAVLEAPSLYDEALRFLARRGHAVPAHHLDRDWSQPHVFSPDLVPVFEGIYENTKDHWEAYHLCEDLVDLESQFQLWRFRHMRTVMRIIGFKKGTGGSSGVGFLKQALELTFFPELFEVRTVIGGPAGEKPY